MGTNKKNTLTITGQTTNMEKLQQLIILFRYWMDENPNYAFVLMAGGILSVTLFAGTVLIHLLYLLFSSAIPGLVALIIVTVFAGWIMADRGGRDE